MMKYFKNVGTIEELRRQYKELLKCYHPDNGGNEEIMKAINVEYEQLFKTLKNRHESKASSTGSKQKESFYNFEEDEKLREILNKVINFEGITITIVGSWIWIDDNTYPYRKKLSAIGFIWSKPRKKWHWHDGKYIHKGNNKTMFDELQRKYGSTEVKTESKLKLAQA